MKVVAIVQARMGSTRLPDKVMRLVGGRPMIEFLLARLAKSRRVDQIVVATTTSPRDQTLAEAVRRLGYEVYAGSESDVLDRYRAAAEAHGADVVVRVTADCPLIDPHVVDRVVSLFEARRVDYASNITPPTYPDGLDVEVFSRAALERAWQEGTKPAEREHVTLYLREEGSIEKANLECENDYSAERWTVDEAADLEVVQSIVAHFGPRIDFGWQEVLELKKTRPQVFSANRHLARNEGSVLGQGQKLWRRARQVIPGGSMLLSKRAEMFLPEQWPAYFQRAKGCRVWDLDGRELVDFSLMGVGTNTLGYGHPEVDEAVLRTVQAGNMSTLNCPEEVHLAERLVALHPWARMARFARSGGEANAIAIRIARAATGRDKIAICGYHGWHDWYLSANLGDERNLAGHLLPGLEPRGVPEALRGTVLPFNYNRLDELEAILRTHELAAIKMEVSRNQGPAPGFLENVRALADERGVVLIFDECTSGFRQTFGGLHLQHAVQPDLAVFGKALGNGYAITGVIGRREVMSAGEITFISSTFWTERIGPTAALKTLEVMERTRSWETITATGSRIMDGWRSLARKYGLEIAISGLPALATFSFKGSRALEYKTLLTQEMLAQGFLAGTAVYVCTEHTPDVVDAYFSALEPVFALIRQCEDGHNVNKLLRGPVCHAGFRRLN